MHFALKSFRRLFTFTMLATIACLNANAQEYSYVHYDVKDGLAGSLVYCGVQDHDGFLWFGTETGLSRFDGTNFQNFTTANGLPDNEITRLFVDSKNRVWIMPFRNSLCYYWKGKIYNHENDSLLKRIPLTSEMMDIAEDKRGNLLFCERKAIWRVDSLQNITKTWIFDDVSRPVKAGLKNDSEFRVASLVGVPAIGAIFGIVFINGKHEATVKTKQGTWSPLGCTVVFPDLQQYEVGKNFLFIYPTEKDSFELPMPPNLISTARINDSLFAANGSNGTTLYDLKAKRATNHFLEGHIINTVFRDIESNLWFLTSGNGIYRLNSLEMKNVFFADGSLNLPIFSLMRTDSLMLIGTEKNYIWAIGKTMIAAQKYKVIEGQSRGRIMAMCKDRLGNIYLGTDVGIARMRGTNVNFTYDGLPVKSMGIDNDTILVATGNHVVNFDGKAMLVRDTVWTQRSTCACKKDSGYFIGTLDGLYFVDAHKRTTFLGEKIPLFRNRIMSLQAGRDGILWVATNGQGLVGYKDGTIRYHLTVASGLTSDICRTIYLGPKYIWLGTVNGLNRIQIQDDKAKIMQFTTADGLASDIINAIYVEGNMVYVGSEAGLTYFDLTKISSNSNCLLKMTGIRTSKNIWNSDTSGFTLPHSDNSVQFDFVGISYKSGGDIFYQYRLLGADTNWQSTRQTSLNFPALSSGDYELQLLATNKFGVKSQMASIAFKINPRMWERTWFKIAAAIIFLLILWIVVNARIRLIKRQENTRLEITKRINELEQKALKAQMNPHFIFNSLNSIQQYVIDKNITGANKFITDFARLIRLTLEMSTLTEVRLEDEINYLSTYLELEKTKLEELFQYQLTVQDSVRRTNWLVPPMILQPFVENAIRHGVRYRKDKKGVINIILETKDNYLSCIITDNGVGREKSKLLKSQLNISIEYQSRGMMLTAKRVEMINRYSSSPIFINIEDGDSQESEYPGTKVTVNFPVKEIHSSNY